MENRRPPRPHAPGRKPYFDRSRNAPSVRGGGGGPTDGRGGGRGPRPDRRADGPAGTNRDGRSGFHDRNRQFRPNDSKNFRSNRSDPNQRRDNNRVRPGQRWEEEPLIKITSDSQITDGKFRGKLLQNSSSPNCMHTARKLREIVFKVISRRVKAGRILDLGAGSGTIGIEAISRGAMLATFVERSARMCSFIKKNLAEMGIRDGHGEVAEIEILPFLIKAARKKRVWDVVYFDLPPSDEQATILDQISRGGCLKTGGLLILEHNSENTYPQTFNQLKHWRTVDQGKTILSIYERM